MFGRATITLGIGPHSTSIFTAVTTHIKLASHRLTPSANDWALFMFINMFPVTSSWLIPVHSVDPFVFLFGVVAVNICLSVNQMIITSGQTNLTTGRIAVAHGRLSVVR